MDQTLKKAKELSRGFYLTLISVIESLALGYLLTILDPNRLIGPEFSLLYWLQFIAIVHVVIITWHEYAMGALCFTWVLNHVDSIIPFLYAIVQYFMIASMKSNNLPRMIGSVAVYAFISIFAYYNQYSKGKKNPANKIMFKRIGDTHKLNILLVVFTMISLIGIAVAANRWPNYEWLKITFMALVNINFIAFSIWRHFIWKRALPH